MRIQERTPHSATAPPLQLVRDCYSGRPCASVIKLVIADDHPVVLHGLVSFLTSELGFDVVAACDDGETALAAIVHHTPDIALLDLRMPKMTGLEILEKVSNENLKTRVVILTAFTDDRDVLIAIGRGVYGIIMKDSVVHALLECLRTVSVGNRWLPPILIRNALQRLSEASSIDRMLTSREREVTRLVAKGLSNKDAAAELQISEGTLKLHMHHIYRKTGLHSRLALMTLARQLGAE
jgi:DNA-binding NarL/FixJ family response regulator